MNSNWSYSPETVKLGRDLCDLDLWPWPFAWTSLLTMVITPENFMMIRWWEHGEKGVTDRRTDGRTDRRTENTICRAAWSQLKNINRKCFSTIPNLHISRLFRILLTGPLGTNFNKILIKIHAFSLRKIHLTMSSGKLRPLCFGLIC